MSSNTSCTIYVDTLIIFCLDDISDKQAPAVIILQRLHTAMLGERMDSLISKTH